MPSSARNYRGRERRSRSRSRSKGRDRRRDKQRDRSRDRDRDRHRNKNRDNDRNSHRNNDQGKPQHKLPKPACMEIFDTDIDDLEALREAALKSKLPTDTAAGDISTLRTPSNGSASYSGHGAVSTAPSIPTLRPGHAGLQFPKPPPSYKPRFTPVRLPGPKSNLIVIQTTDTSAHTSVDQARQNTDRSGERGRPGGGNTDVKNQNSADIKQHSLETETTDRDIYCRENSGRSGPPALDKVVQRMNQSDTDSPSRKRVDKWSRLEESDRSDRDSSSDESDSPNGDLRTNSTDGRRSSRSSSASRSRSPTPLEDEADGRRRDRPARCSPERGSASNAPRSLEKAKSKQPAKKKESGASLDETALFLQQDCDTIEFLDEDQSESRPVVSPEPERVKRRRSSSQDLKRKQKESASDDLKKEKLKLKLTGQLMKVEAQLQKVRNSKLEEQVAASKERPIDRLKNRSRGQSRDREDRPPKEENGRAANYRPAKHEEPSVKAKERPYKAPVNTNNRSPPARMLPTRGRWSNPTSPRRSRSLRKRSGSPRRLSVSPRNRSPSFGRNYSRSSESRSCSGSPRHGRRDSYSSYSTDSRSHSRSRSMSPRQLHRSPRHRNNFATSFGRERLSARQSRSRSPRFCEGRRARRSPLRRSPPRAGKRRAKPRPARRRYRNRRGGRGPNLSDANKVPLGAGAASPPSPPHITSRNSNRLPLGKSGPPPGLLKSSKAANNPNLEPLGTKRLLSSPNRAISPVVFSASSNKQPFRPNRIRSPVGESKNPNNEPLGARILPAVGAGIAKSPVKSRKNPNKEPLGSRRDLSRSPPVRPNSPISVSKSPYKGRITSNKPKSSVVGPRVSKNKRLRSKSPISGHINANKDPLGSGRARSPFTTGRNVSPIRSYKNPKKESVWSEKERSPIPMISKSPVSGSKNANMESLGSVRKKNIIGLRSPKKEPVPIRADVTKSSGVGSKNPTDPLKRRPKSPVTAPTLVTTKPKNPYAGTISIKKEPVDTPEPPFKRSRFVKDKSKITIIQPKRSESSAAASNFPEDGANEPIAAKRWPTERDKNTENCKTNIAGDLRAVLSRKRSPPKLRAQAEREVETERRVRASSPDGYEPVRKAIVVERNVKGVKKAKKKRKRRDCSGGDAMSLSVPELRVVMTEQDTGRRRIVVEDSP